MRKDGPGCFLPSLIFGFLVAAIYIARVLSIDMWARVILLLLLPVVLYVVLRVWAESGANKNRRSS